jgi:hypothetical protein
MQPPPSASAHMRGRSTRLELLRRDPGGGATPGKALAECLRSDQADDREQRAPRFVAGHAPLPGAGRPWGSAGLGKFRPLFGMMKQAVESEALIAAAETEPLVATLLRRRRATAERVRPHRERQRSGMRIARIRFNNRPHWSRGAFCQRASAPTPISTAR